MSCRTTRLRAIADVATKHDLLVFADDMYEKILYDGHTHTTIASLPGMLDRTLTFNGLSKAYAMTGWRLGYVAGPRAYIDQIAKVHSHSVTCATSFAQAGGVAALTGPQEFIGEMVAAWDRRRIMVCDGLDALKGITCPRVEGAFYAFPDIRGTGMSAMEFSDHMLKEAHVALVPGNAFGDAGEGYVRLSFATSDELLARDVGAHGARPREGLSHHRNSANSSAGPRIRSRRARYSFLSLGGRYVVRCQNYRTRN